MATIHPSAIVAPSAVLGDGVEVGAYSVVGDDVEVGEGSWIGPHVVVNGPTRIGRQCRIFQFASIGEEPQDLKYGGEPTRLEIGDRNTIREHVTLNRGTSGGGGVTSIGDDNLIMAYCHVAHDCQIGNGVIFSNNSSLAGHVTIGDHAILSGFTLVHQFCSVGSYAFTGMGSGIAKDVPPYLLVSGNPAIPRGINKVGLKRRGFSEDELKSLAATYKVLYRQGHSLKYAKQAIATLAEQSPILRPFSQFLESSERGIIR